MSRDQADLQIKTLERRLAELDQERDGIAREIANLRRGQFGSASCQPNEPSARAGLSSGDKIALFRSLFRGRDDVFPRRWENPKTGKAGYSPACLNEWARGICEKPRVKCMACPNQAFVPVSDEAIRSHLLGRDISTAGRSAPFVAGVYPLLPDETCWFLAADFDKDSWERDTAAFLRTCREKNVPAVLERSRSGRGGHVWIFFAEAIPAVQARKLGSLLVTETMERCPDVGFESYDRLFPSQDTMPAGGFGNLIALPLQHGPRQDGNSLFVDDALIPYEDQWGFLAALQRMSPSDVDALVEQASAAGRVLGVRLPLDDEDEEPWMAPPSRRAKDAPVLGPLPASVDLVLGNQVYIDRELLPPALVNRLIRLAAFQNPEFYAAQAMRLSTFGKPRVISCAELFSKHLALPRGCQQSASDLLASYGIHANIRDERCAGDAIGAHFLGTLTSEQQAAKDALSAHETGVLAATTAFGKTVVAANLISERNVSTLVLVHRQQLLDQWIARLRAFLDIDPSRIGIIRGGRKKPTGVIDVALIQSLARSGQVSDRVAEYGHIVIDECHHLSAVSFERVTRAAKAKFVLGLSATVTRKDGHHPIIFMQCGPIRYRVDARKQAALRPFAHRVSFRRTVFRARRVGESSSIPIQDLYGLLARDENRNQQIFHDVLCALEAGRSPVVITERKDHVQSLAESLSRFAKNVIVLKGGMGAREREQAKQALQRVPSGDERVIIATGRYLGEGFDDPRLDTLFLTMPISWRGTLAQYAGRLHRVHAGKRDVLIYDYVDEEEPMLSRMAAKREAGYKALGYEVARTGDLFADPRDSNGRSIHPRNL